jgi:hypothetical protein
MQIWNPLRVHPSQNSCHQHQDPQVLAQMWEKGHLYAVGTDTEISMERPQETKTRTLICPGTWRIQSQHTVETLAHPCSLQRCSL